MHRGTSRSGDGSVYGGEERAGMMGACWEVLEGRLGRCGFVGRECVLG